MEEGNWIRVAAMFEEWTLEHVRPLCDSTSQNKLFSNLAGSKRSTRNPLCSRLIREAQHISRNILGEARAVVTGRPDGSAIICRDESGGFSSS